MAIRYATLLTGSGSDDSVDQIDGAILAVGDITIVPCLTDKKKYWYYVDESGATESSPDVIAPNTNAGNKRHKLGGVYGAGAEGDTIAPATNTDEYIPQWNGVDSKTLKNGFAKSTLALSGVNSDITSTSALSTLQVATSLALAKDSATTFDHVDQNFQLKNSADEWTVYAQIQGITRSNVDGLEDGGCNFFTKSAGALIEAMRMTEADTIFNENGVNRNFRVESDTDINAFWISGGTGVVGIGTRTGAGKLCVNGGLTVGSDADAGDNNLKVEGTGYFVGALTAASYADNTPGYEGDALAEILLIKSVDGKIDHSTLPSFVRKQVDKKVYETVELSEVLSEVAFETVQIKQDKTVDSVDKKGKLTKEKIVRSTVQEPDGFEIKDEKVVEKFKEVVTYETELVNKRQLKAGVHFDSEAGKFYQKINDSETTTENGKCTQQNQIGVEVEEQRDLGAMISMLVVAVQQLKQTVGATK